MRRLANPELVFKTTSPQALEWYAKLDALRQEEIKLRNAYEDRMREEFGPSQRESYDTGQCAQQTRRGLWIRGDIAYALDSGYNERTPEDSGWRLDSKDRNWQPKLATKKGKERRAELAELNLVKMRGRWGEIGIPFLYWGEGYVYHPGVTFDAENRVLYVMWGTQYAEDEFKKETSAFPDIQWERIPLSEWHAYVESHSEQDD